jgi:dipeptidyl-peptidase-4
MKHLLLNLCIGIFIFQTNVIWSQQTAGSSTLTIDRIYDNGEFSQQSMKPIKWIDGGNSYVIIEKGIRGNELVRYNSATQEKDIYINATQLKNSKTNEVISVEDFSLSSDESKVLLFTNTSRVWRSNTKGDYWVYNLENNTLKQLGKDFTPSSLMFAKFSTDNSTVAYVHNFNLYLEDFSTGDITQLTTDGSRDLINGTFDWVYEEEFGARDGFRWNEKGSHIAYWQLDAASTGVFNMINNTDSIYPILLPVQYPKVGEDPSVCKIGVVSLNDGETTWVSIPDFKKDSYIPAIQWINNEVLLIQTMNRHQNHLQMWKYNIKSNTTALLYEEKEDTWVALKYPDPTAVGWGRTDMFGADEGKSILRMTENDGWRHVYKIKLDNGDKTLITPGDYDVASVQNSSGNDLYFIASPDHRARRHLYHIGLNGRDQMKRLTPEKYSGMNRYNIAPNGKFAVHTHESVNEPRSARLIELPSHKTITTFIGNSIIKRKLEKLDLPDVEFFHVTTEEGIRIDGRMIKPFDFDPTKKYPVLFHVYGEPWGQVANDTYSSLWDIMMSQKGYIIIDMDNRGTPVLNGSEWRKSIYRKIGVINSRDQALAAKEVLKWDFVDAERTSVWGWSGGGSMTLNLLFRYPEIYKTGVAIAAVAYQPTYDNIYQERYMGLLQENPEDFIEGSPITYAKNLEGNLLLIHGTADDNVHYQNAEMLINELIKEDKQFDLMIYPNRSHGIWEGDNTRKHLYSTITNYLLEHCPVNEN